MPKIIVRVALWLMSVSLCLGAGKTIVDFWRRQDVVVEREKELERVKKENIALEQKLVEIQADSYIEKIARDQLGLVKSGETIVILPQQRTVSEEGASLALPNWRKWWNLFF